MTLQFLAHESALLITVNAKWNAYLTAAFPTQFCAHSRSGRRVGEGSTTFIRGRRRKAKYLIFRLSTSRNREPTLFQENLLLVSTSLANCATAAAVQWQDRTGEVHNKTGRVYYIIASL